MDLPYPEPPRENAPDKDSKNQPVNIWVTPSSTVTVASGATVERLPIADALDSNGNVVRIGGTFQLISTLPKPPNVNITNTSTPTAMNGKIVVSNVTSSITITCRFSPTGYPIVYGDYRLTINVR